MKGDFSRPGGANGYAGVLHQQGRVWLDADWNDEVLARLAQAHAENADLFGSCAVPAPGTAFAIQPPPPGSPLDDFAIGGGDGPAGRCYVDGIPCSSPGGWTYRSQPFYPDPPALPPVSLASPLSPVGSPPAALGAMLVYLEVWQRLVTALQDPALREPALGGPDTTVRLQTVAQVKVQPLPDGLSPLTCAGAAQFLPGAGAGTLSTSTATDRLPPDPCRIADPAAYTGRENALYRVEIHDPGDVLGAAAGGAFVLPLAADAAAGSRALSLTGTLTAAQSAALLGQGSLLVEDDAGSERVAVQSVTAGTGTTTLALARGLVGSYAQARNARAKGGAAIFKWSRSNAADAFAVDAIGADLTTLTLDALGRDSAGALRRGDLIEVSDDASDLGPARGHLTYLAGDPDPDAFTIALADPLPAQFATPGRHPVVRRWDGAGTASATFDAAQTPELDLGDGVRVTFGGSDLRPGDYWQFTARAIDGSLELLADAPPRGVRRHRVPLAVLGYRRVPQLLPIDLPPLTPREAAPRTANPVALELISDCRSVFEPLTQVDELEDGIHVTGVVGLDGTNTAAMLANDAFVPVNGIFNGISVQCDQPLDARSVGRATCAVQVELPRPALPPIIPSAPPLAGFGYDTVTLPADVAVAADGATITWKGRLDPTTLRALVAQLPQGERGLLARLVLDGNRIRSADGRLVLDGETFGFAGADGRTLLQLPSGDGRRGGDFRMWFWLTPEAHLIVGTLFVSNTNASTVTAFDAVAPGSGNVVPRATIGQADVLSPNGVALDRAGNLYVANARATLVLVPVPPLEELESGIAEQQRTAFPFTSGTPFSPRKLMFRTNIFNAAGPALQSNLVESATRVGPIPEPVFKSVPQPPRREFINFVNVFAAGAKDGDAPLYRLGGDATGIVAPLGIALDGSGQLYVVNGSVPTATVATAGSVLRFAAGARDNTAPLALLSGGNTNVVAPRDVAVDAQGYVYVLDATQGVVLVFAPSPASGAAVQYLINGLGLTNPFGIAVDATHVYITDRGGPGNPPAVVIVPLPPRTTSGTHPVDPTTVIRIGGGQSTLNQPAGIDVDGAGTIYVVDGNAIKAWPTAALKAAAAPQGVAPNWQLASSALNGPTYIAFGS